MYIDICLVDGGFECRFYRQLETCLWLVCRSPISESNIYSRVPTETLEKEKEILTKRTDYSFFFIDASTLKSAQLQRNRNEIENNIGM